MSLYYPSTSQGIQVDKIKYLDLARPRASYWNFFDLSRGEEYACQTKGTPSLV